MAARHAVTVTTESTASLTGTIAQIQPDDLAWVARATATDINRPTLAHVLIDRDGTLAAADGFRLHIHEAAAARQDDGAKQCNIPPQLADMAKRLRADLITVHETDDANTLAARFHCQAPKPGMPIVYWQLCPGVFADYRKIIPQSHVGSVIITDPRGLAKRIVTPAGELCMPEQSPEDAQRDKLRQMMGTKPTRKPYDGIPDLVRLTFYEALSIVHHPYHYPDEQSDGARLESGEPMTMAANRKYIGEALTGLREPVTFTYSSPQRPMVFAHGAQTAVVMPMHVNTHAIGTDVWPVRPPTTSISEPTPEPLPVAAAPAEPTPEPIAPSVEPVAEPAPVIVIVPEPVPPLAAGYEPDPSARPDWQAILTAALTTPGQLSAAYSAFHSYSFGNQLLAMEQCIARGLPIGPISTFPGWLAQHRHVRKGEHAIVLCMPVMVHASSQDDSAEETDKPATKRIFVFRKRWFTLAQTDGPEAREPIDPPGWELTRALSALSITRQEYSSANGNSQGYSIPERRVISISPLADHPGRTALHELAHCVLHATGKESHAEEETEAELTGYIVAEVLGIEPEQASSARAYAQHYAEAAGGLSGKSARRIMTAADQIIRAGQPPRAQTGEAA